MDSLPQETIDGIIDNLPRSSLYSSSLVARQWRTRSQQRILDSIIFSSQDKVDRWHSDVQIGGNRILSYVRSVEFRDIEPWNEPALFGRVLKGFRSLETLKVHECAIPDELVGQILRGEFGGGITTLSIRRVQRCDLSTIIPMILSLPNLKNLTVWADETRSRQPPPTSVVSQTRSVNVLKLYFYANEIAEALIRSRLTSRYICLGGAISSVHRLLAISSETLVGLMLGGL